jgi:Response regulator of the LytR/AlgR family
MIAVIIEDEIVAAQKLQRLLGNLADDIRIVAVLQTVEESIEWFLLNAMPDLVFMDIHLADGSAFALFDKVRISCPVIFTTAYDEYALKAFEVNSIDYLLKPIDEKSLERALTKFRKMTVSGSSNTDMIAGLLEAFKAGEKVYKSNFLIPYKDKFIPLSTQSIACIYTENKILKIITMDGLVYSMDSSLEELYGQLDPACFFRANRQYIVAHKAIRDISVWFGGKLSINIRVAIPVAEKIVVSKARVPEFKAWYTK